jgi:aspartate ammonia-lyase
VEALYGGQTQRALDNFQISNLKIHSEFIVALAEIKKAAAAANFSTNKLALKESTAIIRAAEEIIAGQWGDQFQLDVFQAGAGTSLNMNMNEVIANRALELMGAQRGDYSKLHPNDHVNRSQSTNDVIPTAIRLASVRLMRKLSKVIDELSETFEVKATEFSDIPKSGRTHLHDAVPMMLGDEFSGYAENISRAAGRVSETEEFLLEVPLGGTAVGNGVNTHPDYARLAVAELSRITRLDLRQSPNRFQSMQSLGDFVALSAALRGFAIELGKIANDLRLLSSGPHTGLDEIELPAVQPGSSIMPGKVNPSIPEMVNMVCFHVVGQDTAIMMCADAGQLELNVTMPYVAYALLESLKVMANAARTFDHKCVRGIRAHRERCREYAERTVGLAALRNEELGFMAAAELAQRAIASGKTVQELVQEEKAGAGKDGHDLRSKIGMHKK